MRLPKYTVLADADIKFARMFIEGEAIFINCALTSMYSPLHSGEPIEGAINKLRILNCILDGEALVAWFQAHNLELEWQDGNYLKANVNAPGPVRIARITPSSPEATERQ